MKKLLTLIGCALIISLNSCSIEKRLYRSGLHIQGLNNSNNAEKFKNNVGNTSISGNEKSIIKAENSIVCLTDSIKQEVPENLIASSDHSIIINHRKIEGVRNQSKNSKTPSNKEIDFKKIINDLKKLPKIRLSPPTGMQTNGMAVTGFTLSLVGLFIFGFILGVLAVIFSSIGLSRTIKDPEAWGGKGMAIAGLIIGIIDILGWLLLIAILLL